jgi:cobalt-zinc-cadmium efflux system outer membrane protein
MRLQPRAPVSALLALAWPFFGQAQDWTEERVIERFLDQSPYTREARARVESARAEAAGRTLLPNPSVAVSREGAGYAAFFQIEQQLPITGRRGFLKQAGAAAVGATEAESAAVLWALRSGVRLAFYRLLAGQRREEVLGDGIRDLEEVIRVLRTREQEGEGSRYDRVRAERELAEYRSQLALARTDVAQARASLAGFLPPATAVDRVAGSLETMAIVPAVDSLLQRALAHRSEYLTEQRQIERYRLEGRAAGRLRYPEPVATAGVKRGDVAPGNRQTASAVGIEVPLPFFNRGQTEVARWRAEQERAAARQSALERKIRSEVMGAAEALRLRNAAIAQYRNEVNQLGADLSRITRLAYQEGEVGILELLDSYRVTRQSLLRLLELEALAKEAQVELDRAVGEEVLP